MKTAEEIEAWANAYIDCGGIALASEDRPLWWAVEDFMNMSHGKLWTPEECWKTILLILTKAPSANVTSVLAAGPLEDLIRNCGDQFIDRIEIESRRNPAFRNLLGGVWKSGSKEVWERVQKSQGTAW
jgi:hypothetical protein